MLERAANFRVLDKAKLLLSFRWAGPYEVIRMEVNTLFLKDLTGGPEKEVDVTRVKPFMVDEGVDPVAVAAADLGETKVSEILAHRGSPRKRADMEFQVRWSDDEVT